MGLTAKRNNSGGKLMTVPGLNVQWPWSSLIRDRVKTVETRGYALPPRYLNRPLALIETPGPQGRRRAGIHSARIVATIWFSECFRYRDRSHWESDYCRHLVSADDQKFGYVSEKVKWAWVVSRVVVADPFIEAPSPRGIVFASNCRISRNQTIDM